MPTKQQTRAGTKAKDAIALLTDDHKKVQKMFKDFGKLQENDERKRELVQTLCAELTIHAQIEEEIFYPAARDAMDKQDLLDEAQVEHASAKDLIAQLSSMQPDEALYDAKVAVLGEYVNHHVKEEQQQMFPKVRKAKVDMKMLGEQISARKRELQQQMGLEGAGAEKKSRKKAAPKARGGSARAGGRKNSAREARA